MRGKRCYMSNFGKFRWFFRSNWHWLALFSIFKQVKELLNVEQTAFKGCVKNHSKIFLNYVEFRTHAEKDHLCFYRNSCQTFIFASSKVVYFKKHLLSIEPLGKEVSTAIERSTRQLSLQQEQWRSHSKLN